MSDRSAKSAPAEDANEEEHRYRWLKEMKEKNDKEPGKEHWVCSAGALAYAYFWRDMGFMAMRRGPERPEDPMNWIVRITAQGILYVESVDSERAAEQAQANPPAKPIGFRP